MELELSVNADKITAYIRTLAYCGEQIETILCETPEKEGNIMKMLGVMFPVYAHVAGPCCTLYNGGATRAPIKQERRNTGTKMEINYLVSACAGLGCAGWADISNMRE